MDSTGSWYQRCTKYSSKLNSPTGVPTRVSTREFDIGRMQVLIPRRPAISAVTSLSVLPSASSFILRSKLLADGKTLSEVTAEIAGRLGIKTCILPMSNSRVETRVGTPVGELSFEEYFVQRWYQ